MRLLIALCLIAALAAEVFGYEPVTTNYHEDIGIPEAARIKAAESRLDFDGSRIFGGSPAQLGQFPFMGGLVILTPIGQSVCGSSLLTNTRLTTAAHCWNDGSTQSQQFTVVLGSVTLFSGGHRVVTNQVVMHPQWDPRRIANDVAIIHIPHVNYSNNIRNINLPTGSSTYEGLWAIAVGFGRKGDNNPIANNQPLSFAFLMVMTNDACRRHYSEVQATNICTSGAEGRNTCRGDSGGPLALGSILIGITSFGTARGCHIGLPAAYARVTSFASWIRSNL